jgi:hypothetical protein
MSERHQHDTQTTILFVVVMSIFAMIGIANYYQVILMVVGSLLVGVGTGYLLSGGVSHIGRSYGHVGILKILFTLLLFRFLFGTPFGADAWRGFFLYLRPGNHGAVNGFTNGIWLLTIVTAILAAIIWTAVSAEEIEKEGGEENQIEGVGSWSGLAESVFFIPKYIGELARPERSTLVSYLVQTLLIAVLVGVGMYLRSKNILTSEILLNLAIIMGTFAVFRKPMQKALRKENQRIEDVKAAMLAQAEARRLERERLEEEERVLGEERMAARIKSDAEIAERRRNREEKERLLNEAVKEAKPGQGKRTDLSPVNEKDPWDDDLF